MAVRNTNNEAQANFPGSYTKKCIFVLKELSLIFKHPEPHLKLIKYVCTQLFEVLSLLFGGKIVTIPCYFYAFTFWTPPTMTSVDSFDIQTKVL